MKTFTRIACELFMLAGLSALVYGLWLAWHPLGFVVGGALLAAGAFFVHYNTLRHEKAHDARLARERVTS